MSVRMEGLTVKSQQTARRNLAQRITRLLDAIDAGGRGATPWEQHYLSLALDDLDSDRSRQGEETMLWAESRAVFDNPVTPKPLPADARTATVAELRVRLVPASIE